ncbi:MAG: Gfo/Idh/MocA family oxidoreductase [bacterium]
MNSNPSDAAPETVLRAGIVGFGCMGRRHLHGYRAIPGVQVAGAVCRSEATAERARREFGLDAYRTVEELMQNAGPSAVSICTPTDLHARHAIECIRRGAHALVEKPLAATEDEARAVIEESARAGVKLMAGHTNLYSGAILKMMAMTGRGIIGDVREIHFKKEGADVSPGDVEKGLHLAPPAGDGEVRDRLYDSLIHMVYCVDKAAGAPPARVRTFTLGGRRYEESLESEVVYRNGVVARLTVEASLDRQLKKTFTVAGTRGTLVWRLQGGRESLELSNAARTRPVAFRPAHVFDSIVFYFVHFIRNDLPPYSDGNDGLKAMITSRAVVDSHLRNAEVLL